MPMLALVTDNADVEGQLKSINASTTTLSLAQARELPPPLPARPDAVLLDAPAADRSALCQHLAAHCEAPLIPLLRQPEAEQSSSLIYIGVPLQAHELSLVLALARRQTPPAAATLKGLHMEQTHRLLTTAVEQAAESVVITDAEGTIVYVNPIFEEVTGYSYEEAIGQNPRILQSGRHPRHFYTEMWQTLKAGQVWRGQMVNRRKDGQLFIEEATIAPVRDEANNIVNFVAVKRDVTRELQLNAQYQQAQKMEAIGRLAGGVAHDFNNLLTAIMGYVGLSSQQLPDDHPMQEDLLEIQATAERAAGLTRQLLTFARREVTYPVPLDLNQIIRNLHKMLRRLISKNIDLVVELDPTLNRVKADAGQVEQVLLNMAINARDAMPEGGTLTIQTANVTLQKGHLYPDPDVVPGQYVELTIHDTGVGIPPAVQPHIFEPFFSTKESDKGSGLGLAICFGIVKQNKGYIWVTSEANQGTTFSIYLPRAADSPAPAKDIAAPEPALGGNETILLVEDEGMIRTMALRALESYGYNVFTAANGQEALDLLAKNNHKSIDLLLTDLVMPSLGGHQLIDLMREQYPTMKALIMSGYTENMKLNARLLEAGTTLLRKPFSMKALTQAVRKILDT